MGEIKVFCGGNYELLFKFSCLNSMVLCCYQEWKADVLDRAVDLLDKEIKNIRQTIEQVCQQVKKL